jgi:hypothetical protein
VHEFFGQSAMLREAAEPGSAEFVLGRDGDDGCNRSPPRDYAAFSQLSDVST